MSCNGCRVLRKGCTSNCVLRPCLDWIATPEAQGNATLFVSKFFGRSDLISFISAVPLHKRPALFQSLLFEACGRTINPVNGAVGLLSTGNWHVCQAAVQTVLAGGTLTPITAVFQPPNFDERSEELRTAAWSVQNQYLKQTDMSPPSDREIYSEQLITAGWRYQTLTNTTQMTTTASFSSEVSDVSMSFHNKEDEPKLLNLFG